MDFKDILLQYGGLTNECIAELERHSQLLMLDSNQAALTQGRLCRDFYLNKSGMMRVCHTTSKKENTLLFGSEGDIYTSLHSWSDNEPSPFSLIAVVPSEVYTLSYASFRSALRRHGELTGWFLRLCIAQLHGLEGKYLRSCDETIEVRFREFLEREVADTRILSGKHIVRRVPLKYIASYLGVTQETLSRIRRKFVKS